MIIIFDLISDIVLGNVHFLCVKIVSRSMCFACTYICESGPGPDLIKLLGAYLGA